jgi:uncharacterized membrane protein
MFLDQFKSTKDHLSAVGDKPMRSVLKALSWRALGSIDTVIISWIITGSITAAFTIGMVELVTKMVLYYGHERIWNRIQWGKQ